MQKPLCVVVPPGLQALLTATGLVRTLAADRAVLVAMDKELIPIVPRLFAGNKITFWFGEPDPVARAGALGLETLILPNDPRAMYKAAKVPLSNMHTKFHVVRDDAKERELLERIVRSHGASFAVAWPHPGTPLDANLLPTGVPIVYAPSLSVADPLQFCMVLEHALQVHAVDGWFLTLADLLGSNSGKFCHSYASLLSALVCRRKYRRRVTILSRSHL